MSPRTRTFTSSAERPRTVAGRAVCARKPALSTSEPSGFEHRNRRPRFHRTAARRVLHRADVVVVQRQERVEVAPGGRFGIHGRVPPGTRARRPTRRIGPCGSCGGREATARPGRASTTRGRVGKTAPGREKRAHANAQPSRAAAGPPPADRGLPRLCRSRPAGRHHRGGVAVHPRTRSGWPGQPRPHPVRRGRRLPRVEPHGRRAGADAGARPVARGLQRARGARPHGVRDRPGLGPFSSSAPSRSARAAAPSTRRSTCSWRPPSGRASSTGSTPATASARRSARC
jgi:hypothetical protein